MSADETRKQVEEDAKEDLELEDKDADKVGGGATGDFFLKIDGVAGESADAKYKE